MRNKINNQSFRMQCGIANGFRDNQRSQSETAGSREVTRAPSPLHPKAPEGPREW